MKLLIIFPNATYWATVSTAVPILVGIAKYKNWQIEYFDTYNYKKTVTEDEKEKTGGFKAGFELKQENKEFNQIVTDLQEKINSYKPDLIAITALSTEYDFLLKFFPQILIPTKTKVVIGGIHTTLKPEQTLNTKLFDIIAFGEGEETFNELLTKIENNESLSNILGTYYYDKEHDIVYRNPKRRLLSADKLWEIQHDFSLFKPEYFLRPFDGKKIMRNEIEISRGCPYHCAYCGNRVLKEFNRGLGKYVKTRPINSSIKQMKELKEKFNINLFVFADECFLSHPFDWIKEFMSEYKKEIDRPYLFMTRSETVTEEKIQMLLSFNIPFQISIGVESGSDRILKDVCDRSCTNEQIMNAFTILNRNRIRTNAFFIVGFPWETREDTFKTINLCRKIKPSVASVSIFQPYPGQKLTSDCIEQNFYDGQHIPGSFTDDSLLNMPEPYLSNKEIKNLWRVFMLYATLPKKYYKDIEKCEFDYANNKDLYNTLIDLRWKKYDWAEKKGDIKLFV